MSDAGGDNRKHLLKLWFWALVSLSVLIPIVILPATRTGDLTPLYWATGAIAVSLVLARAVFVRAKSRFAALLLEPTPEPLLAYTRTLFNRAVTPHTELILATSLATQRALWGQFDEARRELEGLDWNAAPPMYRAMMLHARALVHYLSRDDVAAGLQDARNAEALGQMPSLMPGAASARSNRQLYIDIGRVLCEGGSAELAASLDRSALDAKRPVEHAISLWGSALAHASLGQEARAAELRAQIAKLAPHCAPLQRTDTSKLDEPHPIELAPAGSCERHPESREQVRCNRCGSSVCSRCARTVSGLTSFCPDCTAHLRELRQQNLARETRLRAVGLCQQIGAISFGALLALSVLSTLIGSSFHWSMLTMLCFNLGMVWFLFHAGRSIQGLRPSWQRFLRLSAILLLLYVPIGTVIAAGVLWQLRRPPFDAQHESDYQRAVMLTPELTASRPWLLGLALYAALSGNLVFWAALIINALP